METYILTLPKSTGASLVPITVLLKRKAVIASAVGCGICNCGLKASSTQMAKVGRLHNSQVIFVMGNAFLFYSVFLPFELANDSQ